MPSACTKLIFVFLLFSAFAQAQTQNLFFRPPTYTGDGEIVSADFNGDGKADLVTADGTILLGNGDGTFRTGTPWSVTGQIGAGSIATADFNGDGKPDLLVTFYTTILYVLLGNGDGTFQPAITTNAGAYLVPAVTDVNGDGIPDVTGISGGRLFVFLGTGNGGFQPSSTFPIPNVNPILTATLVIDDFNGDGKKDVAIAGTSLNDNTQGVIVVMLGKGDGTFPSSTTSSGETPAIWITSGDFNEDGKPDLIISNSNGTSTLLGKGDGTFQAASKPLPYYGALVPSDLNGDHRLDLVILADTFVFIFLGNGDGTFHLKESYLENSYFQWYSAALVDLNGDGKVDIATGNVILLGEGDGTFQGNAGITVNQDGVSRAVAGDFNGDGIPDIAVLPINNSNSLYILLGDGTGQFALAHTYTLAMPGNQIATADMNGDGKLDLVVVTAQSIMPEGGLNVLLGNGDGSFGAAIVYSTGQPAAPIVLADFNGDHNIDAAYLDASGGLSVAFGNGDGTLGAPTSYFVGSQPTSFVVGDFNNDKVPDLAVVSSAGLGILLDKGNGTFGSPTFPFSGIGAVLVAAELNGDGNLDLICTQSGNLQTLLGKGDGTFIASPATNQPVNPGVFAVADFNGDNKLDLAFGPGVQVYLGNGDGTFINSIAVIYPIGKPPVEGSQFLLAPDLNRDGHPDIVVDVNSSSAGFATLLNISQPQPDFQLTASSLSPSGIAPGASTSSTITLTSANGFTGSAVLSCSGLPSGASCAFKPSSVNAASTSTLTIATTSSTPTGIYPVTATGMSASLNHTATITLIVADQTSVTFAPTSLTFTQLAIGTTSSPQSLQLLNSGASPLTVSSISVTGTNASDFGISSSTCGVAIAAGASCTFNTTFSPTGMGARTASISVAANISGSPQTIPLSGTGPDFSLSATTLTKTVPAGQTATYAISIAPSAGFNQTVSLTCTGNPALTACTVSPDAVSLNGTSAANANVTITTTAPTHGFVGPVPFRSRPNFNCLWASLLLVLVTCLLLANIFDPAKKARSAKIPLLVLLGLSMALTSCGGGSGNSGNPGTQAGTYTITVNATSGTNSASHSATLTLVVQ